MFFGIVIGSCVMLVFAILIGSFMIGDRLDRIHSTYKIAECQGNRIEHSIQRFTEDMPDQWLKAIKKLCEASTSSNPLLVWFDSSTEKWLAEWATESGSGESPVEAIAAMSEAAQ